MGVLVAAIRKNRAKEKLQNGQVVTTISGHMSSEIIDFLGPLGFDVAWLECEHGPVSWEQISDMTRACDLWGLSSVTRVNSNEPWLITRTLDRGSMGIVVPHVNTREDAEQAMQSAKFEPLGYRGMFGGRQSYGVSDYFQRANDQTMVVVLLEERQALQNLDEILQVDYVDVFFVAPSDLAQTMGHLGNPAHPEVQQAIDSAIAKIISAGRVAGTLVNDDNVASYGEKGVQFLMTSWNGWLVRGAREFLSRVPTVGR
jgi:2-keto-3-deoxy-L-rhamnonate aldolase RhmA